MTDTDYKSNTYDDDDMRAVLTVLDEKDDEAESIMAAAMGKVAGIRKWQKAEIKRAKDELGIPTSVLKPLRKMRALERQMQKIAGDVSEDMIEVFEDATGQFSMFASDDGDPADAANSAQLAARQAAKEARERQDAEQAEGEQVLNDMAAVH